MGNAVKLGDIGTAHGSHPQPRLPQVQEPLKRIICRWRVRAIRWQITGIPAPLAEALQPSLSMVNPPRVRVMRLAAVVWLSAVGR